MDVLTSQTNYDSLKEKVLCAFSFNAAVEFFFFYFNY